MEYKLTTCMILAVLFAAYASGENAAYNHISGHQEDRVLRFLLGHRGLDKDCFYVSTKYVGPVHTTFSGKQCIRWIDFDPSIHGFPDATPEAAVNSCRDPFGRGFPWCYTSLTGDWEFCPVNFCQECFFPRESGQYEGYVSVDSQNNTCSLWSDHRYVNGVHLADDDFPEKSIIKAKNYCRDVLGTGSLQCVVRDQLRNCSIPQCLHECTDDVTTNCDLLKEYVCKYEQTAVELCPKSCLMCKFGLLPPVATSPQGLCIDVPDADCDLLQNIICSDPHGAVTLCPKTCGKCHLLTNISTSTTHMTLMTSPTLTMTSPPSTMTSPSPTSQPTTSPSTTTTTTATTTVLTTTPNPYWLPWGPWGSWSCSYENGTCLRTRFRNCSTYSNTDCERLHDGTKFSDVGICNIAACPEGVATTSTTTTTATTPTTTTTTTATTTTTSTTPTTTADPCQDSPDNIGCNDHLILHDICKDNAIAWQLCPRSCGLCHTCWDYFPNCNTTAGKGLFCSKEDDAIQYCRKSCGKCDHEPVTVHVNSCGDPVMSDDTCHMLHTGMCICNDPDARILCRKYCDQKCPMYPTVDLSCTASRRKRDEFQ